MHTTKGFFDAVKIWQGLLGQNSILLVKVLKPKELGFCLLCGE